MAKSSKSKSGASDGSQLELALFESRRLSLSDGSSVPVEEAELWTSKQRQASSLHEVSYRACFKPQLPRHFIKLFTKEGDLVYDPFGGRGTTAVEAALLGRKVASNDANPLAELLCRPRLEAPPLADVEKRLREIDFSQKLSAGIDLSMFYHPGTLAQILCLRKHLLERRAAKSEDSADRWLAMVATNRLTGHSKGFLSVYTLPPNQAVSPQRQILINEKLKQKPEFRDLPALVLKKSRQLLGKLSPEDLTRLRRASKSALFMTRLADSTPELPDSSVALVVTSPPFLDIVQYKDDNWLRCWFNGIDAEAVSKRLTMARCVEDWTEAMARVFVELRRVLKPEGRIAFEVGELRNGKIRLEEQAAEAGLRAGLRCERVFVNLQRFTKTSNIWGVSNNAAGTNSNRIVLFAKG